MHRKMRVLVVFTVACCVSAGCSSTSGKGENVKLQGAGASFPAPLYAKWFKDYKSANKNVLIDYQSVGSGQGVKSVIDGTVDFGASDAAMSAEEIAKVDKGVVLLPMPAAHPGPARGAGGSQDPVARNFSVLLCMIAFKLRHYQGPFP